MAEAEEEGGTRKARNDAQMGKRERVAERRKMAETELCRHERFLFNGTGQTEFIRCNDFVCQQQQQQQQQVLRPGCLAD